MLTDRTRSEDQFGASAESYLTSQAHNRPHELKELVERLSPYGGKAVDVGTGAGHMAFALAPHFDEVIAYDPTPQMLAVAVRVAQERGLHNIQGMKGYAESLPFADESLTGVSCRVAAHHFKDVTAFVREAARVLRPGGWFALVDVVSPEDQMTALALDSIERRRDPSHVWNLAPSTWNSLCRLNGLEPEWDQVKAKPIDLDEWVLRMKVPQWLIPRLRDDILGSTGKLQEYLDPREVGDRVFFSLHEMTLICRK